MAPYDPDPPVQCLGSEVEEYADDTTLPTHACTGSEERYVLWSDIQETFLGVDYVRGTLGRLMFMIDDDDELCQPLRILYAPSIYTVVYSERRAHQEAKSHRIQQENDQASFITITRDGKPGTGYALDERLLPLKCLFKTCEDLHNIARRRSKGEHRYFRQTIATMRYYHSLVVEEMERLDVAGVKPMVDVRDQWQIRQTLGEVQNRIPDWDNENTLWAILMEGDNRWEFATSPLFIVLPSDLTSTGSSDGLTHQFRLYFMCDSCWRAKSSLHFPRYSPEKRRHHTHISNHPGYVINRPQEFFHVYGDYVRRVLTLVKNGLTGLSWRKDDAILPLDTFTILWGRDISITGGQLSKDTIEQLVNKAIACIEELSPPSWAKNPCLTRRQSAEIKTYLDIQEGDNAEGNLYRTIGTEDRVNWICRGYKHCTFDQESLEKQKKLEDFVHSHGGYVHKQQGELSIVLGSTIEAEELCALLVGNYYRVKISIKPIWEPTRPYFEDLLHRIMGATDHAMTLEIEGNNLNFYLQGYVQCRRDPLFDLISRYFRPRLVTFLNYPQPQEQCMRFKDVSLRSTLAPGRFTYIWADLQSDLNKIGEMVSKVEVASDCDTAVTDLRSVLEKYGLSEDATVFTVHKEDWVAMFDLKAGAFVEVYSQDLACPKVIFSSGTLKTLTMDQPTERLEQELCLMIQNNPGLQELNISSIERYVLDHVEHIARLWGSTRGSLRLTLYERTNDSRGRVLAQVVITGPNYSGPRGSTLDTKGFNTQKLTIQRLVQDDPMDFDFLQWDCHYFSSSLSDYHASLLARATSQHPSVLSMFTLNISPLSRNGLANVQTILRRSTLECLNVVCSVFSPDMFDAITALLGSVQWSTLKYLVLSGDNIDQWIQLWPSCSDLRLLYLHIRGTRCVLQELSHSSVLFLVRVAYSSLLFGIRFKNVVLKNKRDWVLIYDSFDPSWKATLGLCDSSNSQFLSAVVTTWRSV